MKLILLITTLTIFNFANAQTKLEKQEILKKIVVEKFDNELAFEMGSKVIELAKSKNLRIAIEIARLNHTVFLYVHDSLSINYHNWLRRKANVAKQFEESSLSVKNLLKEKSMTLSKNFALDEKDFVAIGGAIPILVKGAGMIATITVTGLPDEEDHKLIIDALKGKYF